MTDTPEAVRLAFIYEEGDSYDKKAAALLRRFPELEAEVKQLAKQAASVRSHLTDALAFLLCEKDGNDDPHHLIWEGGAVPEPWGEVWQKYLPDAESLAEAAFKSANDWGLAFDEAEAQALADAEAALDQLRAELEKVRVPEGWKLVPVKPTEKMVEVGYAAINCKATSPTRLAWNAMITAAPTPPHADQKGQ